MILDKINPMMAALGPGGDDGEVLNLLGASMTTPGGQVLSVPALRVQLHTVSAWWAARHIVEEAPSRGGVVGFVGVQTTF
ncbi:hypothetical protein [Arthrobacter mobilis]|uniref:Uncharacterized protein n=1 Tax=Arthrobacter mobilis TaxID=2724944 RepID=A0A7X6K6G7_9MICC|nr:hypothetical protein [Arthrobacter mobilis]NKX55295.1 hypothetical protein [Arthrobacter mobilis]